MLVDEQLFDDWRLGVGSIEMRSMLRVLDSEHFIDGFHVGLHLGHQLLHGAKVLVDLFVVLRHLEYLDEKTVLEALVGH